MRSEQVLSSECSRLLTTYVISYNAAMLSRVRAERRAADDLAGVEQFTLQRVRRRRNDAMKRKQ